MRVRSLLFVSVVLFFGLVICARAQNLSVNPSSINLVIGGDQPLTVSVKDVNKTVKSFTLDIDAIEIKVKSSDEQKVNLNVHGVKELKLSTVKIRCTLVDKTTNVESEESFALTVEILDPSKTTFAPASLPTLKENGADVTIRMTVDGKIIANERVSFEGAGKLRSAYDNGIITVEPSAIAKVNLNVLVDRVKVGSPIPIDVVEGVDKIAVKEITLKQGETRNMSDYVSLVGTANNSLVFVDTTCSLDKPEIATLGPNCSTITAGNKADRAELTVRSGTKVITAGVIVRPSPKTIIFPDFDPLKSLIKDTPIKLTAQVIGDDGEVIPDVVTEVKTNDPACVSVIRESKTRFSIRAEKTSCVVALTAEATVDGVKLGPISIPIGVSFIKGFSPLKIRLDLMDDRVAKDLFGTKTAQEFFVTKARLFNKIRDSETDQNSFWRNPILVYSESLETKVAVQYKCGNDAPANCSPKNWTDLEEDKDPYKSIFPKGFPDKESGNCERDPQKNFMIPYRPLVYEMITNTQDNRSDRTTRSKVLTAINSLSSAASFVTSIAIPGAGSDLPLGLEKFKNLLIPSVERLFPSMREANRQNVIRYTMRPLEEIPFGSDITKVLFFPKSPIKGMIPGYLVRITGVSVSNSCAEVALIQKVTNL